MKNTCLKLNDLLKEATDSVIDCLPNSSVYRGRCTLEIYLKGGLFCVLSTAKTSEGEGIKMCPATNASPGDMFLLGASLSKAGLSLTAGKAVAQWSEDEHDKRDRGIKHVQDRHRKIHGVDPVLAEVIPLFKRKQ